MAQPHRYQYVAIVGPVLVLAAFNPADLTWLPQGRQPSHRIEHARQGDYVVPPISEVLYKAPGLEWLPSGQQPARGLPRTNIRPFWVGVAEIYDPQSLDWLPRDRYAGRLLTASPADFAFDPFPIVFDPATLDWLSRGQQPTRGLAFSRQGEYVAAPFEPLYDPEGLQWIPGGRYPGRPLPRSLVRFYVLDPIPPADPRLLDWIPQDRYFGRPLPPNQHVRGYTILSPFVPLYDPEELGWLPRGQQPARELPPRRLGDYFGPVFDALYKPEGLQWSPAGESVPGRPIPAGRIAFFALDPFPRPIAVFDPATLEWIPRGQQPARGLRFVRLGDYVSSPFEPLYDPEGLQWLPQEEETPGRGLPAGRVAIFVLDPQPIVVFDPQTMEWALQGQCPQRGLRPRILGVTIHEPFAFAGWIKVPTLPDVWVKEPDVTDAWVKEPDVAP